MTTTWTDAEPRPEAGLDALERIQLLQGALFGDGVDGSPTLDPDALEPLVAELNRLRLALGWLPVDLDGRWCWPD